MLDFYLLTGFIYAKFRNHIYRDIYIFQGLENHCLLNARLLSTHWFYICKVSQSHFRASCLVSRRSPQFSVLIVWSAWRSICACALACLTSSSASSATLFWKCATRLSFCMVSSVLAVLDIASKVLHASCCLFSARATSLFLARARSRSLFAFS